MKVIFILHGAKESHRKLPKKLNAIRPKHLLFYYCFTNYHGSGRHIVYENAPKADIIAVVGGDGTLNECLNGLMIYKKENPEKPLPAIALLPYGSANDFARNFDWKKKSIDQFLGRLMKPHYVEVDTGKIAYADGRIEYFFNEVSTGISASVVNHVAKMPSFINGNIKFGWAIFIKFLIHRKKKFTLSADNFDWDGKAIVITCSNGKYVGSGLGVAPEADLTDGIMDVSIFGDVTLFDYLKNLMRLKRCQKIIHPQVHYFKTKSVHLHGKGLVEKDGEPGSALSCEIRIADKMKILV